MTRDAVVQVVETDMNQAAALLLRAALQAFIRMLV